MHQGEIWAFIRDMNGKRVKSTICPHRSEQPTSRIGTFVARGIVERKFGLSSGNLFDFPWLKQISVFRNGTGFRYTVADGCWVEYLVVEGDDAQ